MKKASSALKSPVISAADRFGFTLFISAVINAVVVLGVSFSPFDPDDEDSMAPTLEVILVPTRSERAPEEADFLAQSNQIGGGEADDKHRPSTPTPAPFTTADDSTSPAFMPKVQAQPKPDTLERELLTAQDSDWAIPTKKQERPEIKDLKTPTAAEMVQRGKEIAQLTASLAEQQDVLAKKPRPKFISAANAKEYKYASYIADWERKVEKVGSLNFPDEAKRKGLHGDLLLDVAILPDGTVFEVQVRRSSGYTVLDDAARRIVHLAAPFAPFPPGFRKDFDVLHITRTWQFLPGGVLRNE